MAACVPEMRAVPDPLYGVTLTSMSGATQNKVNLVAPALTNLPHMPITRLVFDETTVPEDYTVAIDGLRPYTYLMGELLDSYYLDWGPFKNSSYPAPNNGPNGYGTKAYRDRAAAFVNKFSEKIDIWEIGNEVNGNWTGPYADVGAKIAAAYDVVAAAGKRSALTLWYNNNCGNGPSELSPQAFTTQYVPDRVRLGVDYVTVSFYETECTGGRPSVATLKSFFQTLHGANYYPNSKLGFGEIGLPFTIDKWNTNTTNKTPGDGYTTAKGIADYYYALGPQFNLSYYTGGYFYWYFQEDCIPTSQPMWNAIHHDMTLY